MNGLEQMREPRNRWDLNLLTATLYAVIEIEQVLRKFGKLRKAHIKHQTILKHFVVIMFSRRIKFRK